MSGGDSRGSAARTRTVTAGPASFHPGFIGRMSGLIALKRFMPSVSMLAPNAPSSDTCEASGRSISERTRIPIFPWVVVIRVLLFD